MVNKCKITKPNEWLTDWLLNTSMSLSLFLINEHILFKIIYRVKKTVKSKGF